MSDDLPIMYYCTDCKDNSSSISADKRCWSCGSGRVINIVVKAELEAELEHVLDLALKAQEHALKAQDVAKRAVRDRIGWIKTDE